jgi:gamma-glutamyltranspeptidase/glutathione hydrolase
MNQLNWSQPYSSGRSPVCAENVVATSQPLAVQAGLEAMREGGNAVDAALAAAITLTVVEPNNNGLGSDAFAILWDGDALVGLNASGRSPRAMTLDHFSGQSQMPIRGWDTVTVPGAVSAWMALSQRYGRLEFPQLFQAAIGYARDGFQVGPKTAYYWQLAEQTYKEFPAFCEHFMPAPLAGSRFRRPDMATTLEKIATSGGESFYEGEIAQAIAAEAAAAGALLSFDDLAQHRCDWVNPIAQPYGDIALHEIPPNGQGLAAQIALGILARRPVTDPTTGSGIHLQVEAMKLAIRAAFAHFADPSAMRLNPEQLLGSDVLEHAAASISESATLPFPVDLPVSHDTVYLAAADRDGMMVSFIQSNYLGFGSGIVIPGTGISMQNRGCGFSLDSDHPNCLEPGKRPFHTIIPGFVSEAGAPRMAFGVMGGHMQHQGHVQMVNRIFDHHENPQAASDAPRWHVFEDYSIGLEPGVPTAIADDLRQRGHTVAYVEEEHVFGGAQLILRTDDGYVAGSDHRKEGLAAGF